MALQSEPAAKEHSDESLNRVKTRQDTDAARALAFRKILAALNEGYLSTSSEESGSEAGADENKSKNRKGANKRRRSKRNKPSRHQRTGNKNDDEDYVQPEALSDDEYGSDMDFEDSAAPEQYDLSTDSPKKAPAKGATAKPKRSKEEAKRQEKKLILRIKMAKQKQDEQRRDSSDGGELRFEDIDWSGVDLETINDILERRERLQRRNISQDANALGEASYNITSDKLKKSSLAPPPRKIERSKPAETPMGLTHGDEASFGSVVDDSERQQQQQQQLKETEQSGLSSDLDNERIATEPVQIGQQFEGAIGSGGHSPFTSILAAAQASDETHGLMTSEATGVPAVTQEEEEEVMVEEEPITPKAAAPARGRRPRGRPRGSGRASRGSAKQRSPAQGRGGTLHLPPKSTAQNRGGEGMLESEYPGAMGDISVQQYYPGGADYQYDARIDMSASNLRRARRHPALIGSGWSGNQAYPKRDMRVVMQYELSQEQHLLNSLRSEIIDRLAQLETEERLLRLVVGEDIVLSEDEEGEESMSHDYGLMSPKTGHFSPGFSRAGSVDPVYARFSQHIASAGQGQAVPPSNEAYLDNQSESSLSGMSDSDDENEEVARNALRNLVSQIDSGDM
ncbi:hypothetical protein EV182_003166 [Spiromyces aspiralis]|uniref:Uncharacterized protein n=1 Tax=Spiromyces aspiralis TaxID=68401 RepID=A0ACC1HJM0_9FUNG|nr:hypothetical protein EV182_003166 [Spiromyces aspiralis]